MKSFTFWSRWLLVVSIVVAVFGTFMALFNGTTAFSILNDQINPVFWENDELPEAVNAFQRFVYGAWGATVAGWGIFMVFIARVPFKRRERWAWFCLLCGILFWYILDTSISLYYGVNFNALFNTILFVAGLLPLVFTYRNFLPDRSG